MNNDFYSLLLNNSGLMQGKNLLTNFTKMFITKKFSIKTELRIFFTLHKSFVSPKKITDFIFSCTKQL